MKRLILSLAIVTLSAPLIASAATDEVKTVKPFKMTCEEFLSVSETYKPAVVYWIASVDKLGVRENDQIVIDTPRTVGYVVDECRKEPTKKLSDKVRTSLDSQTLKINYNGA